MKYSISLVVHNNLALTQKCVELVQKYSTDYELLISDNASTDGTKGFLIELEKQNPSWIRVFYYEQNMGFIIPNNEALRQAHGEYFVVLNNDVDVCPNWLEVMSAEFEKNPNLALCGIHGTCTELDSNGVGIPGEKVEYIEGSCLMGITSLFLTHGLFSNDFKFAYYEDSDLGLRMRQHGFDLTVVKIPVIHYGAKTAKIVKNEIDLEGYQIRNQHVFLNQWGSYLRSRNINKDRIVVRRGGACGDVILTTPVIHALKQKFPNSLITVLTQCPEVFFGNPDVAQAVRKCSLTDIGIFFDLDLSYEHRPSEHIVQVYAEICGVELKDWKPRLFFSKQAEDVILQRVPKNTKFAVIHPGTIPGWVGRQWSAERFSPVIDYIQSKGYMPVLIGDEQTPGFANTMDLRNIPFQQLCALMARANLFVGLDSMPLHVAQAFGVPIVAIFGSVASELRLIPNTYAIGVTAKVGCIGCHHYLPGPRTCTSSCIRGREWCMELLTSDQVIDVLKSMFREENLLDMKVRYMPVPGNYQDQTARIEADQEVNSGLNRRGIYRRLKKNRKRLV